MYTTEKRRKTVIVLFSHELTQINTNEKKIFVKICVHSWLKIKNDSIRRYNLFEEKTHMIIGIPKEIKPDEYRVALIPVGVEEMLKHGHTVLVENGAGLGSGIPDQEYKKAGAKLANSPKEIYDKAKFIMKVKEPLPEEYPLLNENHVIFTFSKGYSSGSGSLTFIMNCALT